MKYSVEKEIARYPVGVEMNRPEKDVYGVTFCYMFVGDSTYVWRSENAPVTIEVGQRGGGATFYCKINSVITEHQYPSMREAAIAGVKAMGGWTPPPARVSYRPNQHQVLAPWW